MINIQGGASIKNGRKKQSCFLRDEVEILRFQFRGWSLRKVLAKNAMEKIRVHVPNSGRIGVFFGELTVTHFKLSNFNFW